MYPTESPYLSLVIPVFNEAARIEASLRQILRFLQAQPYSYEVVIVDDGSSDDTASLIAARFGGNSSLRILREGHNRGKGAAVRKGMLLSRGNYLFFSDADLSVPIETLPAFLRELENKVDLAIATRQRPGARIEVRQPLYREMLGKVYSAASRMILGLPFSDFTCGFKGFRRSAAEALFSKQRLTDWSFDSEILYLAHLGGYRTIEIPVIWRNDHASKVRLRRDIATSLWGLVLIRINKSLGKYQ